MGLRVTHVPLHLLALGLAGFFASGCVIPFASPPVRVTQAFGLAAGEVRPERTSRHERVAGVEPVSVTRIGVHPLQLVSELRHRRVDFGLGYAFETFTAEQLLGKFDRHAVYGELTAFPVITRLDGQVSARVGTTLTGDLLFGDGGYGVEVGAGGSVALTLEIFGFVGGAVFPARDSATRSLEHHWDDEDDRQFDALLVAALGEWSVGMSAYAAYRALDGASYAELGVAVSLRLPASAGAFVFFPRTSRRHRHGGDATPREYGTDDTEPSSSTDGDYHADAVTPSDGGIGAGSDDDDDDDDDDRGTVEVNPPPARGTVEVNPP